MKPERVWGKTPAGGDYAEFFYIDADGNLTDGKNAVKCMIHECTKDGKLIQETISLREGYNGSKEAS